MAACGTADPGRGSFADTARGWAFTGPLTLDGAAGVLAASQALALPSGGVVDFSGLTQGDSAALAIVIALKRRAVAEQRELRIVGLPASLHSLAVVYGVEDLLA